MLLLHLCGPAAKPNSQLFSAAQSRDQAALLFGLAAKMVRLSPHMNAFVTVRDTAKQLYCGEMGTLYRALAADATTAYGLSPVFIVHDELGQVKGSRSPLYEALETATGAQENPLSIIISTQAPTDGDLLSMLIDDAKSGHDPRTVLALHTADKDADPFTEDAIRAANPAFGDFLSATEVLAMADDAKRMPSREPEFRNLILNQRVEARAPFVSRTTWMLSSAPPLESFDGMNVYAGLDLSATRDLTALVVIAKVGDIWHVRPTFWLPSHELATKARTDHVPYDLWRDQGYLETTPGAAIRHEYIAIKIAELFGRCRVRGFAYDRWHMDYLRPHLGTAGITETQFERIIEFGQGYKSMAPAIREFETLLADGKLAHGDHPVLSWCAANAVADTDPAGNKKLVKDKSSGRIDGMVALAMAIGAATLAPPETRSIYDIEAEAMARASV